MINAVLIFSDKFKTTMMQHFDLFDASKVVLQPQVRCTLVKNWGKKNLQDMLKALEGKPYNLVAVVAKGKVLYRDENIKMVSNGKVCGLLDDYIAAIKFD